MESFLGRAGCGETRSWRSSKSSFLDFQDRGIFHHIVIVGGHFSARLSYWHRKAGILPLHQLLAELAS